MVKRNRILLAVILCGLFLCGIGAGVCFSEFSSMEYIDEPITLGEAQDGEIYVTLDQTADAASPIVVYGYGMRASENGGLVQVDEQMEEGVVRVNVCHDPEYSDIFGYSYCEDYEGGLRTAVDVVFNSKPYADMRAFFEIKDTVLRDLKNNSLRSYSVEPSRCTGIVAAPKTAARIVLR